MTGRHGGAPRREGATGRSNADPAIALVVTIYIVGAALPAVSETRPPMSLGRLFERAVIVSETLQRSDADLEAARARYDQAVATLYPRFTGFGEHRYRDDPNFGRLGGSGNRPDQDSTPGSPGFGGARSLGTTQADIYFTFSQPLFLGFREEYLKRASRLEQESISHDKRRRRELLYLDVARLYLQLHLFQRTHATYDEHLGFLDEQVKELRAFADLGKSRDAEVVAAQASLANVRAERVAVDQILRATKEALAFFVAIPAEQLRVAPLPALPAKDPALTGFVARVADRADVKSLEKLVDARIETIEATRRELWPSLSADVNLYAFEDPDRNRQWDSLVRLQVPIFDGWRVDARVKEQEALARRQKLDAQEAGRRAEQEVRTAHGDLVTARGRLKAARDAVSALRKNVEVQREDYRAGVVNNLEVLRALENLESAQRSAVDAEISLRLAFVRLEVAAGEIAHESR